jgi:ubiquinone biosynthesis protein COQ4
VHELIANAGCAILSKSRRSVMTSSAMPFSGRKDWTGAFKALRKLLADANDTEQVFRIMRGLNTTSVKKGYARLIGTVEGGRIAYQRVELAQRLSDPAYIAQFGEGTVGGAYAAFLRKTGYTAEGLAAVSRVDDPRREIEHPIAWYGRRMRDSHDIWHILTGYRADDPLGEACLTAFAFAQTRGLGWAAIALGAAVQSLRSPLRVPVLRALWEGYRNGRRAAWLPGQDYELILAEPLIQARARLGIASPEAYLAVDISR